MTLQDGRLGLALLTLLAALGLGACDNTIRGVGADLEESGDAIEDSTTPEPDSGY